MQAFDLEAMGQARRLYGERPDLELCAEAKAAVTGAYALVICTEWKQFRVVDFARLKRTLALPVAIDGRNLWDPGDVRDAGLLYFAVGRGASLQSDLASIDDAPGKWLTECGNWVTSPQH